MKRPLAISDTACSIVKTLQEANFETYVVGGAVRDLLLNRTPKDFDISTSATPEEIRAVFGRRKARIIGKRFRLVHLYADGDIYEISTFRQAPRSNGAENKKFASAEHLILSDNDYGSAEEDAWRRDFTMNALFYDPSREEVLDLTGMGVEDIANQIVRAIGEPKLRFEEDPVRMLRALKMVAQFDFELDNPTENALFECLPLLKLVSPSRLTLELEKILKSSFCDRHFEVFHDYGLLPYFLPELSAEWGSPLQQRLSDLLYERNCRVDAGLYRDSVSLAIAAAALPFVERAFGNAPGSLWDPRTPGCGAVIADTVDNIFKPQNLMVRMREAACRILTLQPLLENPDDPRRGEIIQQHAYAHARELMLIRHAGLPDAETLEKAWPRGIDRARNQHAKAPAKKRPKKRHFSKKKPEQNWNRE